MSVQPLYEISPSFFWSIQSLFPELSVKLYTLQIQKFNFSSLFFVICISTDDLFDVTSSPYHSTLSNHSLLKSYIMSMYDVSVELTPGQLLGHS